jgi:hypothetical protein
MREPIQLGDISVSVVRAPQRKTIALTVERDGTLSVRAPSETSVESLKKLLKKKELWIHSALAKRQTSCGANAQKLFVTGEGFLYLGRHYRLRVVSSQSLPPKAALLRLHQSRFFLAAHAAADARKHFVRWYSDAGSRWLEKHISRLQNRVGVSAKSTAVRDLGYRWGSCTEEGRLNFHWRTFMLPPSIIEYLVLHELCHLIVHNHSKEFWKEVSRVAPDYQKKEAWLMNIAINYNF